MNVVPLAARASGRRERTVPAHWYALKRSLDVIVGGAAAIVSLPIVAIAALGIVVVSPGSPFFLQERVGLDSRRFKMVKLRTMIVDAERYAKDVEHLNEVPGPVFKIKRDPRLHPLGALLRRLKGHGLTILIVDHDMNLVEQVADHITVLNFGRRIADGPPRAVLSHPDVIAAYLGEPREDAAA